MNGPVPQRIELCCRQGRLALLYPLCIDGATPLVLLVDHVLHRLVAESSPVPGSELSFDACRSQATNGSSWE